MVIKYCESVYQTIRRKTRQVMVGNVGVGGNNPVRIQSMTTSNTRDVQATLEQIFKLADYGCEIARVTVQGMKEAEACEQIKSGLLQKGYSIPLVADIHFYPPAAMKVIEFVDKVRINPGNFLDKRATFKIIEYDDISYAKEVEKIEEKFTPLVQKCKALNRSMRIGTNHGSLSDRIMNRYGDTPRGMVESALEFARVCRKNDYHDFLFSMKSSNPQVMIHAYRLLVAEMYRLGWDYPLHLGVTEAGEGEDGRIKSAMGIGSLLLDGIGDTIRVSLTEDPWYEIDPCQRLINIAQEYERKARFFPFEEKNRDFTNIQRRKVVLPKNIGLHRDGTVILGLSAQDLNSPHLFQMLGCGEQNGFPKLKASSVDSVVIHEYSENSLNQIKKLKEVGIGVLEPKSLIEAKNLIKESRFRLSTLSHPSVVKVESGNPEDWKILENLAGVIILSPRENRLQFCRHFFEFFKEKELNVPVILHFNYDCSLEDLIIQAGAECGALLCDGLGEGIWLEGPYDREILRNLSFNILQAARMRIIKTDFISCPSCGRTLFDLQDVSKKIRSRTQHLPGVKIAIMGCIVNGPGEMADADFGYVGSKPGKIDLYVGKECIEKDIDFSEADDRLVALIKAHGRWVEAERF